jgi:hypothetical protein
VKKITDRQQEFFPLDEYSKNPIGEWEWENSLPNQLGTKKISVPNSPAPELGTEKIPVPNLHFHLINKEEISVPNSDFEELGTGKSKRSRAEIWKPPTGLLTQKWVKTDWYWYWQYYDNRLKKRSLYLHKKYNKAVAKAQLIGIPADAKPSKCRASPPATQNQTTDPT